MPSLILEFQGVANIRIIREEMSKVCGGGERERE